MASDNFDQLLLAVDRLKGKVAEYAGTGDIQDSFEEGKLEMKLQLKPQARTLGLTLADLARQVRQGFYGDQALRFPRGSDDVRVMVRYPKDERRNLGDVRSMRVRTPSGAEVPFYRGCHRHHWPRLCLYPAHRRPARRAGECLGR